MEATTKLSFEGFSAYVDYWKMHADPDGADASEIERRHPPQQATTTAARLERGP